MWESIILGLIPGTNLVISFPAVALFTSAGLLFYGFVVRRHFEDLIRGAQLVEYFPQDL